MLVAFAAVWFIVFLPSVGKRSRDKDETARARREERERLTANASPVISAKVGRAKTTNRVFLTATVLAIVATLVAVFQGSTLGAIVGVSAVAVFAVLSRVAKSRISRTLETGSRRRAKMPTGLTGSSTETEAELEFVEDNSWSPNALPQQAYQSKLGTLETPNLADVVNIEFPGELDSETLDEILRRRRAN